MPDRSAGAAERLPAVPLGILGGTFDPVHRAHLALAQAALDCTAIGALRWIPAGQPPHRPPPVASGAHRLAMLRDAVGTLSCRAQCEIDPGEIETIGPSYTVDTLERLRRELGMERPLVLILGADAFLGLENWHRWATLTELAHLLVTQRPGHRLDPDALPKALQALWRERFRADPLALAKSPAGLIHRFEMPASDTSATSVRAHIARGEKAVVGLKTMLLPETVRYIERHHLYR